MTMRRGVTLIELLVAISLLGVVAEIGFGVFRSGYKAFQGQMREASELDRRYLSLAGNRIRRLDSCKGRPMAGWLFEANRGHP